MDAETKDQPLPQIFIDSLREAQELASKLSWFWNFFSYAPTEKEMARKLLDEAVSNIKQGDLVLFSHDGKSLTIRKVKEISGPKKGSYQRICHLEGDPNTITYDLDQFVYFMGAHQFMRAHQIIPILESATKTVALIERVHDRPLLFLQEQTV